LYPTLLDCLSICGLKQIRAAVDSVNWFYEARNGFLELSNVEVSVDIDRFAHIVGAHARHATTDKQSSSAGDSCASTCFGAAIFINHAASAPDLAQPHLLPAACCPAAVLHKQSQLE
jgi:hypothetical protein